LLGMAVMIDRLFLKHALCGIESGAVHSG
jgi:hypothetical protein